MKKSIAESICEEFSCKVHVSYKDSPFFYGHNQVKYTPNAFEVEEIKCLVHGRFFDALADRMDEVGYTCNGFQKDGKKCITWFKRDKD